MDFFFLFLQWSHTKGFGIMNSLIPSFFIFFILILTIFNDFFFKFYLPILNLLDIEFHNLFWFIFYNVIPVWWPETRVLQVNCVDLYHFPPFLIIFSQLHPSTLSWELSFIIIFYLLSIGLSQSHDPICEFCRLAGLTQFFFLILLIE